MKKILLPFLALIFAALTVVGALAQVSPAPVKGTLEVNGFHPGGVDFTVTSISSGEVLTSSDVPSLRTSDDGQGVFFIDFTAFKGPWPNWFYGREFEFKCDVSSACVYRFRAVDFPHSFNVVINDPLVVVKEVVKEVPVGVSFVCWDGSTVLDRESCPDFVECKDGTKASAEVGCPEESQFWLTFSLISGLVAVVAAGLLALSKLDAKKYKWAKGLAGILNFRLARAKKFKEEGKEAAARKELDAARKTAETVISKHLKR